MTAKYKEAQTYHVHKAICPFCDATQEVDEGLEDEDVECETCQGIYTVNTDLL